MTLSTQSPFVPFAIRPILVRDLVLARGAPGLFSSKAQVATHISPKPVDWITKTTIPVISSTDNNFSRFVLPPTIQAEGRHIAAS
jgi:hypothetical protein